MIAPENPSAFPFSAEYGHSAACGGMTLRDYFAGKVAPEVLRQMLNLGTSVTPEAAIRNVGTLSYTVADAMLAARKTENIK